MSNINFPKNPAVNDTYTFGTKTWQFNGIGWTSHTNSGSGGTTDYNVLNNKPKINNIELSGNKTSADLGLQSTGNYATTTLVVFKNGINGNFYPRTFKWPTDKTISSIQLISNCNNILLSIGNTTYDKTTAINVLLPANTEMTINDLIINAGFNYGEALIIF
jgi:hypothetical protein